MNNHITDKQLQAYLDKQDGPETTNIEDHLKLCASCQKNLEEYHKFYHFVFRSDLWTAT